jgi:(2Fe-2S) ferredoxin
MVMSIEEFNETSLKCVDCVTKKFSGADGKRHLLFCGGTGCLSSNSNEILETLQALIKENHLEDKVDANKVGCFGFCSQGPFVKVLPEDTLYRMVKVEDAKEIIEKDIIGGEIVERLIYVDPQTKEKVKK